MVNEPPPEARINFWFRRSLPVIYQAESAECGLACLAMILKFHGGSSDLAALRTSYGISIRGMRMKDLIDASMDLGLAARPVKFELEDISHLKLPCVLHWKMDHFVVLAEVKKNSIVVHDPAKGRQQLSFEDADKLVTGIALELEAGPNIRRKRDESRTSLGSLTGPLQGLKRSLFHVFVLALLLELLGLLAPQFMQMVVDQVLTSGDTALLTFLGVSFVLLLFIKTLVEGLRSWVLLWLGTTFNVGWTANIFSHLMRIPLSYFGRRHVGDVISRFGAIGIIQQTVTAQFTSVIIDGIMAIVTGSLLFYYDVKLAAITLLFAILYLISRALYFRNLQEVTQSNINLLAVQQNSFIEAVRSILTIKINNMGGRRSVKYMNATTEALNMGVAVQRYSLAFGLLGSLISGGQRVAVVWTGAGSVLDSTLTVGMLMAFIVYSEQFTGRFVALSDYYVQFRLLRLHGGRLADIVRTEPESHIQGERHDAPVRRDLVVRSVFFRYSQNSPMILNDVSFEVKEKEVVAITGPSGCGKSTIAKVLVGALENQSGRVLFGGVDRDVIGRGKVRDMVSCVLQEDQLLSGSIADNICLFDGTPDLDRVRHVCDLAQLSAEIKKMPMGYNSQVGDMGASLSGGQKQRVLLARALYRNPSYLILDEATSHLDVHNESRIADVVRGLGLTTLIIAHRPTTINSADRVYHMGHGGNLVEMTPGSNVARDFH